MYIRLMQWFGSQILNQIDQLYSFEYNIAHDYKVILRASCYVVESMFN
jgi:hypothetical protein